MTGVPFEFQAGDAIGYHGEAKWVLNLIEADSFQEYLDFIGNGYSDMGFSLFLTSIYYVFGPLIIIPRLFNALFGAWSCLLIYDLTKRNFGEKTARISAVLTMLLPNLIYYTGLHLKETLMLLIVIAFINLADKLLRSPQLNFKSILTLLVLGGSLFFFRTVLAVSIIFAFAGSIFLISNNFSNVGKKIATGVIFLALGSIFLATSLLQEVNKYIDQSDNNLESQMQHFSSRVSGNKLAKYGSKSIFMPLMLIAPFPTFVDTGQENLMMLSGAYYTRNVFAFFVFIALILFYKRKLFRKHILIVLFVFTYLIILASSGFALSERFHLPALPFLVILAAYGITQMNKKNKKYFTPYLLFVSLLIIGWNWFKLAGRDLI